jgi:hypothetical protein
VEQEVPTVPTHSIKGETTWIDPTISWGPASPNVIAIVSLYIYICIYICVNKYKNNNIYKYKNYSMILDSM